MQDRTVQDVLDELSSEQKDMLYILIGTAMIDGGFRAHTRMSKLPIDFFSVDQSKVAHYLINEAVKRS